MDPAVISAGAAHTIGERLRAQAPPVTAPLPTTQVDDVLVVTGKVTSVDLEKGTAEWRDGVIAVYGPTRVEADRLFVDQQRGEGVATGNVRVIDPDGTLNARNVTFRWRPENRGGTAEGVEVIVGRARVRADSATIDPGKWVLKNVRATSCGLERPLFEITARTLTVVPGKRGTAERPGLIVGGSKLFELPTYGFSLDRRAQGIRFPNISRRRDGQFGVNWVSGIPLDDETALSANASIFRRDLPSYGLVYTKSFVPGERTRAFFLPEADTHERFIFGYFDSVENPTPEFEAEWLRDERASISVGSLVNQGVNEFRGGDRFLTKPIEVTYERGGKWGNWGVLSQSRLHFVSAEDTPTYGRATFLGSAGPPIARLGRTTFLTRVDTGLFVGPRSSGWVRGMGGAIYQPERRLKLGLAAVVAAPFGNTLLGSDDLFATTGFHARLDLDLGPTRIFLLQKWDIDRKFYDFEASIYQTVGCFQVFLLQRQYPRVFTVGIRLRFDDILGLVERRRFDRKKKGEKLTQGDRSDEP